MRCPWNRGRFKLAGQSTAFDPSKISNLYGDAGPEVATNNDLHNQYGTRLPVFIEDQNSAVGNHGKELMVDALAVASVFALIDPTLNTMDPHQALQRLFDIMEASAGTPGKSLENTLDALRTLFQQNYPGGTANTNAPPTFADRDSFYTNLLSLQGYLKGLPSYSTAIQGLGFTVDKLTDRDTSSLAATAKDDIATRYALYKLNSFVVKGTGLYEAINTDHLLDRYDASTGGGVLTDEYLKDRAALLRNKIVANNQDHDIASDATTLATTWVQHAGQPQYFEDNSNYLPYKLYLGSDASIVNQPTNGLSQIKFGGSLSDTLTGGNQWDKLYGMAGNDTLRGNKGNDYLEGGQGTDTYNYTSGDGLDTILDTDGLGKIRFDGTILNGGDKIFGETYKSSDGKYLYTLLANATGQDLLVSAMGGQMIVKDFQSGELGINLNGGTAPAPTSEFHGTSIDDADRIDTGVPAGVAGGGVLNANWMGYVAFGQMAYPFAEGSVGTMYFMSRFGQPHPENTIFDALYGEGGDDYLLGNPGGHDFLIDGGAGNDTGQLLPLAA